MAPVKNHFGLLFCSFVKPVTNARVQEKPNVVEYI